MDKFDFSNATHYHSGQFPPKTLDYAILARPLSQAVAAIGRYDGMLRSLRNSDVLLGPLRRQEAVVSSRIEGTVATLDEVLQLEAASESDGETSEDTSVHRQEVAEVLSYSRALTYAQREMNEGLPISSRLIREAHGRLLFFGRGADKQPGHFKTDQNYVVDRAARKVLFVPIPANELEDGIARLERFIHDEEQEPVLQTAITHVEFEALHPFKDGNGRVGRMLIPLMLWDKKLISAPHFYISSSLEQNREEYIERMRRVSQDNDWTGWCLFFLQALEAQALHNLQTAERINALYEEMKVELRSVLASQWSVVALDFLFTRPVFRNNIFTLRSGIPAPTARRFSRLLLEGGLLNEVEAASGRRPATYAFEPLLKIVRG